MNNRLLTLVNLALLAACGGCIYYLTTAEFNPPREIQQARDAIRPETDLSTPPEPVPVDEGVKEPRTEYTNLVNKESTRALYTPPPTPTPEPSPTPPPPSLFEAVKSWQIASILDDKTVELQETRPGAEETFTLTIGGEPHVAKDAKGAPLEVRLITVDLDNFTVELGYLDQIEKKSM